ncbi:MAG: hypothetical protein NBV60_02225 [Erythrobacter sp.]|nr:hypothetical protein [Erythrobacter sp.]
MSDDGLIEAFRPLLWSPVIVSIAAGLLYLTGAINPGTVGLLCSFGWLPWWIAAAVVGFRSRSGVRPLPKSIGYSLLIGCVASYGVMWGVSLIG